MMLWFLLKERKNEFLWRTVGEEELTVREGMTNIAARRIMGVAAVAATTTMVFSTPRKSTEITDKNRNKNQCTGMQADPLT
jgi:hypothetical protein